MRCAIDKAGRFVKVGLDTSCLALLLVASVCAAQDWPQWRGPARDGALPASAGPRAWPEKLTPRWKVPVGEGHSSPVFAAGRIFVFTREQDQEVLRALEPGSGQVLWRAAYPAPYTMNPAATRHGKGPKSTPVVAGGRVYTLGISGILSAFDAATGKLVWRREFGRQFPVTSPLYGAGMSPLVDQGLLIVHAGGNDSGALTALDAASGEPRWSWTGDGPGYASPIVAELAGVRQVITETQKSIVGVSARSGELLWQMPFTTPYVQNCVTPLVWGDLLIVSGLSNGVRGVRVGKKAADPVWHNKEVSLYMSSPVVSGNLVYGFSHLNRGQLFALDPRTGATVRTGDPRQADNAALLAAGEHLLILTNDAQLTVSKGLEPQRRYTVADSPTWAHPLVLSSGLVIKDASTLALWTW